MHRGKGSFTSGYVKSRYTKIAIAVIIVIIFAYIAVNGYVSSNKLQRAIDSISDSVSAHFIDIGQGDATLLRSPDGRFMLIDCGMTANGDYLVKYLSDVGVERLDYLLITHPHEDHYGGCSLVMENFEVERLVLHKDFADTYPYDKFIDMAEYYGTDVVLTEVGDEFQLDGGAEIEIIAPKKVDADDLNESSLCLRVTFGDRAFMFTGDAETGTEGYMLSSGKELSADVFKAGHHGSSTSNSRAFVKKVNPEYAVVSCAKENDYGHPHRETVALFEELGIKMLGTYEHGNIVFVTDGSNLSVIKGFLDFGMDNSGQISDLFFGSF